MHGEALHEDEWYLADEHGQAGPLTLNELRETLATMKVDAVRRTLIWREGYSNWKSFEDVPEFRGWASSPPAVPSGKPPPPPSASPPDGFPERKVAAFLDDFREQSDFWHSEQLGTRPQVKDGVANAGKSYLSRLRREFFRNRQFAQRDNIDRRRSLEVKKTLRPTPTVAGKVFASSILLIVGLFAALIIIGLFTPNTGMTRSEFRAPRSVICAMTGLSGLSMDDERALRNACYGH